MDRCVFDRFQSQQVALEGKRTKQDSISKRNSWIDNICTQRKNRVGTPATHRAPASNLQQLTRPFEHLEGARRGGAQLKANVSQNLKPAMAAVVGPGISHLKSTCLELQLMPAPKHVSRTKQVAPFEMLPRNDHRHAPDLQGTH